MLDTLFTALCYNAGFIFCFFLILGWKFSGLLVMVMRAHGWKYQSLMFVVGVLLTGITIELWEPLFWIFSVFWLMWAVIIRIIYIKVGEKFYTDVRDAMKEVL